MRWNLHAQSLNYLGDDKDSYLRDGGAILYRAYNFQSRTRLLDFH